MNDKLVSRVARELVARMDAEIFGAFMTGHGATDSTTATNYDDAPELTLEHLQATMLKLEATLPVIAYIASKWVPVMTEDGQPAIMYLTDPEHIRAFGVTQEVVALVILHPDILPELQRRIVGYRLVNVHEKTVE